MERHSGFGVRGEAFRLRADLSFYISERYCRCSCVRKASDRRREQGQDFNARDANASWREMEITVGRIDLHSCRDIRDKICLLHFVEDFAYVNPVKIRESSSKLNIAASYSYCNIPNYHPYPKKTASCKLPMPRPRAWSGSGDSRPAHSYGSRGTAIHYPITQQERPLPPTPAIPPML